MLLKCVFYSALASGVIKENPAADINPRGGKKGKERDTLSDQQVSTLLETIKGLPPYPFVMIGLYAGLRREEILALQWDCVFLDEAVPYIAVRRAWRTVKNRPEISTTLKTPAARRDIPIPGLLVNCLREEKAKMDIYAKVKYNQPKELSKVVNQAFTKRIEKWHEGRCSGSHAFPFHNAKGANIKNMGRLIDSRAILW